MKNKLAPWQGWLLFGIAMAFIFALGVIISSLSEYSTETMNTVQDKKIVITGIEARSYIFGKNYPREYQTWVDTLVTNLSCELNATISVDILAQRPEMVILWAGYTFSKDYSTND